MMYGRLINYNFRDFHREAVSVMMFCGEMGKGNECGQKLLSGSLNVANILKTFL